MTHTQDQLKWEKYGYEDWMAVTQFGAYRCVRNFLDVSVLFLGDEKLGNYGGGSHALSKEAAQADYEKRLSALVPAPAVPPAEQEPVAWIERFVLDALTSKEADDRLVCKAWSYKATSSAVPLYARPVPAPAVPDDVAGRIAELEADLRFMTENRNKWQDATTAARREKEAQAAELARLRDERYRLAYAICGGEDAHGLLDSTPVEALENIARKEWDAHTGTIDALVKSEAENARLRSALTELCEACSGLDIKRGDASLAAARAALQPTGDA